MNNKIEMNRDVKTAVILAAAGSGSRVESLNVPKQFYEINKKPVLCYSLEKFQALDSITSVVIATSAAHIGLCAAIVDKYGFDKVTSITAGGETRQQSVYNGLKSIPVNTDIVLVHDAARPLTPVTDISALINAVMDANACFGSNTPETDVLPKHKEICAAVLAVKVADTVKNVDDTLTVTKTLDRDSLWLTQTPQAIPYNLFIRAYESALANGFTATDDVSLVERIGGIVKIVPGSPLNFKITTEIDLLRTEYIINHQS